MSLSPVEFLRSRNKSAQDIKEFKSEFWESYERQGGVRKKAEKEIVQPKTKVEEVSSTCQLSAADKEQLLEQLKPEN